MSEILKGEEEKKEYCDGALKLEEGVRTVYLMLAERLHNIRESRLYEPFWSSWHEFTMEFKDLSPASISKMISVYDVFVLQYGFKPNELSKAGGWTKLYGMMKKINSKQDALDWLEKAESHSRQDLEKMLVESKTGVSMHECKHPNTVTIIVCEDCGEKIRDFSTS
jgi:hypothetical protein